MIDALPSYLETKKGLPLIEALPREFQCGYDNTRAWKYRDVKVVEAIDACSWATRWPGNHKNVYFWVKLENGYAVGWNENPSTGWSFPVIKLPKDKS